MQIYHDITELIGRTPLAEVTGLEQDEGLLARLFVKLEGFNPAGSAKDRIAKRLIEAAEKEGVLKRGSVIIEPTSGNTGIGLAAVAAYKGYRVIFTMPETMSVERQKLLRAYGAELVLTAARDGMEGAVRKAEELAREIPGSFLPGQFSNPENPRAHYLTTGPEIWADTEGRADILVAGVGTGGTLTGAGRFLKEQKSSMKLYAVEPAASALLSGEPAGPHGLQGIGANFIPEILDRELYDGVFAVTEEEAYTAARKLARREGYLAGISSGACLHAALELARNPENAGKWIVALLPDSGERYLSTSLFD